MSESPSQNAFFKIAGDVSIYNLTLWGHHILEQQHPPSLPPAPSTFQPKKLHLSQRLQQPNYCSRPTEATDPPFKWVYNTVCRYGYILLTYSRVFELQMHLLANCRDLASHLWRLGSFWLDLQSLSLAQTTTWTQTQDLHMLLDIREVCGSVSWWEAVMLSHGNLLFERLCWKGRSARSCARSCVRRCACLLLVELVNILFQVSGAIACTAH